MQASATLQSLIAEGQLEQAIGLYISLSQQYADVARTEKGLHESARFHALKQQDLEGTISQADYQLEWSRINRAVLSLSSQVPAAWKHPFEPLTTPVPVPADTPAPVPSPTHPAQKTFLERWGLILGLVASLTTILGVTLKDFIFPKKETATQTEQPKPTNPTTSTPAPSNAQPAVSEQPKSSPLPNNKAKQKAVEKPATNYPTQSAPAPVRNQPVVTTTPPPAPVEKPGTTAQPRFRSFSKSEFVDGMERGHDGNDHIMYRNLKTGQILCCYDDGDNFNDGKARVSQNGQYFYIDKNGNRVQ
jgi:Effector-associated domain 11